MSTSLKRTGLRRYRLLVTLLLMVTSGCVWATELAEGESDTWTWNALTAGYTESQIVEEVSQDGGPVTIRFNKGAGASAPRYKGATKTDPAGFWVYTNGLMTIKASEGYAISGLTLNFNDKYAGYTNMTPSMGNFSATFPSGKNEKSVGTWVGFVPFVTITNISGQKYPIASITVSYTRLAEVGEVMVKSVGVATYCPVGQTVVVGDGTKTYIYTGLEANGTTLTEEALPVVPQGTGVMIAGTSGETTTYNLYSSDELTATAPADNLLVGVTEANTRVPSNSYVLQNGSVGLAFYYVDETVNITMGAGKAYLKGDPNLVKAALYFRGGGKPDPTAISDVLSLDSPVEAIYNMQGIRQNTMQHGLNIIRLTNGQTIKRILP